MGNSSDKIVLLKEQLANKKILAEKKYYTIYEDENDSKQYEYWLQKSKVNSFSAQEQFLSDLRSQKDSSIVAIRNFSLGQIKEWFTTEYLFAALIDHPKYNLLEFLLKKDIQLAQHQIYLMISQLLGAEVLLDKNSQFLGLNNIFSSDEHGLKWYLKPLRTGDLIISPNQNLYHLDSDNVIIGFPPPEYKVGEYDKESTKIFSLGMILLQMTLNESNSDIYNEKEQFQMNVFEQKIQKLKEKENIISKEFVEFMLILLNLEPQNRTTFKNLTLKLLTLFGGLPKREKDRLQNYLSLRNSKESVYVSYNDLCSVPLQEQDFLIKFNHNQQKAPNPNPNPQPHPQIIQEQNPPPEMLQSPHFHQKIIQEVYSGTTYQNLYNGKGRLERKFSVEHIDAIIDPKNLSLAEHLIKTYDGEFKLSKKNGFGKITYLNDDTFEGYFQDDQINGQGVFTSKEKSKKGIWKNNVLIGEQSPKNSQQTLDQNQTNFYSFNLNLKSKQQEVELDPIDPSQMSEQDIYQGEFDDTRTGKGKLLTKQSQVIYEGNFINGLFDGQGTFYNLQAVLTKQIDSSNLNQPLDQNYWNQYSGQFKLGKKNGQGTIFFTDKSVYTGEFLDDKITGNGSYSLQNSFVIKGTFNDGSKIFK